MASPSMGSPSASQPSPWFAAVSTCDRSYFVAAMRAGAIALVLLGVLALLVWV